MQHQSHVRSTFTPRPEPLSSEVQQTPTFSFKSRRRRRRNTTTIIFVNLFRPTSWCKPGSIGNQPNPLSQPGSKGSQPSSRERLDISGESFFSRSRGEREMDSPVFGLSPRRLLFFPFLLGFLRAADAKTCVIPPTDGVVSVARRTEKEGGIA